MNVNVNDLSIKIFLDSANIPQTLLNSKLDFIKGFTTNPSLAYKAGIQNYKKWINRLSSAAPDKDFSFEVVTDSLSEMVEQGRKIAAINPNIYVKIPIVNSEGRYTYRQVEELSRLGIKVNVTAIFTPDQVQAIEPCLDPDIPSIVSVFAGRIADTGVNPLGIVEEALWIMDRNRNAEVLWASCRETYNIIQANDCNCDIITVPESIIMKLDLLGKNLEEYSIDTVGEFYEAAKIADFKI